MAHPAIAALDGALAENGSGNGEWIKLRRVVGSSSATQVFVDVDVRAHVGGPSESQLIAGIDQNTFVCIFSPTQINRAQWPGGQPPSVINDPRIPAKDRGDKAHIRGAWRAVQWGQGFYPGGELVRIEMRVLG